MEIKRSKFKVAVLTGGIGSEREVSIQSGNCVAEALKKAGLSVVVADITPDNIDVLGADDIDVFFIALHGKFGEDGQLQQILEDKGLLYTGSGPAASKLAFDKIVSKKLFAEAGINTPVTIEFYADTDTGQFEEQLQHFATDKYVVKPVTQGSSVGVNIITDRREVAAAAGRCLSEFGDCMVEEFIPGQEITVGILCGRALPIIEVQPKRCFYDYDAKYIDEQTEYLFDTIDSPRLAENIEASAIECYNAIGCRHFARVDSILGDDGVVYVLELNTIPGLTTHSLVPKAAAKAGLSMSDLCVKIIEAALKKSEIKS
ncbi:MAG: D-alanine--D-alanine ligase [Planctomycetota bacterium]